MLAKLQAELQAWQNHNFPTRAPHVPLLGVGEELGELASLDIPNSEKHIVELMKALGKLHHARIKREQKIRLSENHELNGKDACADLMVFLADYCNAEGWSLEAILQETWDAVKQRDWVAFPKNGRTE